jgi:hypothetical protein
VKHGTVTGIAAATLIAVAACGGSGPSSAPASYLAASTSRVAMVQWRTTSGGHVRGTIAAGEVGGSAPGARLSASRTPFTGTVRGNSVTLTFPAMLFLHTSAHGRLSGGTLTLRLAQPDGTLKQTTFRESGVARYNRAVAALRRTISRTNAQFTGQLAGHTQRQVSAHDEQLALTALYRDSSLAHGGVLPRLLARFARDTQTARSDLATEKNAAAGSNSYCEAAFTVGGDAQKVSGDLRAVQGDTLSMNPAIASIRAETASARISMRQLTRAGLPAPSSASVMISNAQGAASRVTAMANSYVSHVNAIGTAARSIANNIATGRCSSARSGSWVSPVTRVGLRCQSVLLRGGG